MARHLVPAARLCFASVLLLLATSVVAQDPVRPAPAATPAQVSLKCVQVRDIEVPEHPFRLAADRGQEYRKSDDACAKAVGLFKSGKLTGAGDVIVTVTQDAYRDIVGVSRDGKGTLTLFLNGVPLPADAERISVENRGANTHIRFRINQGPDTQVLWAMLYRQQGLLGTDKLRAGRGWSLPGATPAAYVLPPSEADGVQGDAEIEITSHERALAAGLVLAGLLACLYSIGRNTDALRDAPLPDWWKQAAELRAAMTGRDEATRERLLRERYPDYAAARRPEYATAAALALARAPVAPAQEAAATLGLALHRSLWKPVRASFSLSRVQMALWFTFAIAAGLFLWIVYGQLRRIDNSVLVLLGLSVGTAGISMSVDRNAGGREYMPSKGIFTDLVTGFDDKQQVHRYQAVVVNLLLLFVGISHVLQHLTYPIFEPTWLALLGVSGVALGVGKQAVEQARALPLFPAPTASRTAAAGAGTDGALG